MFAQPKEPLPLSPEVAAMTEKEKMQAGILYSPMDPEILKEREEGKRLLLELNALPYSDRAGRVAVMRKLFGKGVEDVPDMSMPFLECRFHCDFGRYITFGPYVYINNNVTILDGAPIKIGAKTAIATNVQIIAATHPISPKLRSDFRTLSLSRPVTIGELCWLGAGCIIMPGVTLGDRVVVGAGSVVTKDVPSQSVVAGNPARVIRTFTDKEDPFADLADDSIPWTHKGITMTNV
ncbi:hypothetical protein RI367_005743 [Sorochytrium milnesiophthora]